MNKEKLCEEQIKEAQWQVTPHWNIEDLEQVLKQLKNQKNKSCDPLVFSNELFKPAIAGKDLKITLKLMNEIKRKQEFPDVLKVCNVTSLNIKKKISRKKFNNREIFKVAVRNSILDKLFYIDE